MIDPFNKLHVFAIDNILTPSIAKLYFGYGGFFLHKSISLWKLR